MSKRSMRQKVKPAEWPTYDEATHTSWLRGCQVPHVTSVLSAVGVSTDFASIVEAGGVRARHVEAARVLGSAVHHDTHAYDDGDLDVASVDVRVWPFLQAWISLRNNIGATPLSRARERYLFCRSLGYCGFMDGLFQVDGKIVLFDIKTGDPEDAGCRWQTAAYQLAYESIMAELHEPARVDERWGIQLVPDARVPYRIHNYSAEADAFRHRMEWEAFLTTYRKQAGRRAA
jgi:hypothetical protein